MVLEVWGIGALTGSRWKGDIHFSSENASCVILKDPFSTKSDTSMISE